MGGEVITYSTGLSAFHAMIILLNLKKIFIGDGYHGCHGVLDIVKRLTGIEKKPAPGISSTWKRLSILLARLATLPTIVPKRARRGLT
jgi:hypothetical protein